jgi:site-specific recombinase XerD
MTRKAPAELHPLVQAYLASLSGKAEGTIDAYRRALRDLVIWLAECPTHDGSFRPEQLTRTALDTYLTHLATRGQSLSHRARIKSVVSGFAEWLMEEHGSLPRNPARGIVLPPQPLLAPRQLTPDQRFVLRTLVERESTPRSEAIFALGYWAGCRVSDIAWLRMDDAHVGPQIGWVRVGHKGGKLRDLDLVNDARRPLYTYLNASGRTPASRYVFTSQRSNRLTEAGIHHWFRALKARATKREWDLIGDLTFHDLRHDFAHRVRVAGWTLEEVTYYLGHVTKKGTPAIQTTARYTQVSRDQLKAKVHQITG